MLYSVRINTGSKRFIMWCDEHWYESCGFDNRRFTYDEAVKIIEYMTNHYQYHLSIIGDNFEEVYDYGKKNNYKPLQNNDEVIVVVTEPVEEECEISFGF